MYKKILFTILACSLLSVTYAQKFKKFTAEPEAYFEELDKLFSRSATNYDKGKELIEKMQEAWANGSVSDEKKKSIYEISNILLKKRARNFPHFYSYLNTVFVFTQKQINPKYYADWEKGLKELLSKRKVKLQHIQTYIQRTHDLIVYNSLYYSSSVKWIADNKNYDIVFENDTLKIKFEKVNLIAKLRKDSIFIRETSGELYPLTNTWKGNTAKVYWTKVGLSKDSVYAEVGDYEIKLNKAAYTIKNVKFYNKYYFDYSLLGTLKDKVVETAGNRKISYPKFESNEKNFKIKNLFEDINYKGGFNMNGSKVIGTGSETQNAELSIYRDVEYVKNGDTLIRKELFMSIKSMFYTLTKDYIVSQNAKISMYLDKDSIYHSGLMFKYMNKNREINLIRDDNPENMSRSLYYNTYHNIEMDFELLKWSMNEKKMNFTMLRGAALNIAKFESLNYFSASRYYEAQGLEDIHPYILLRKFTKTFHTQEFTAEQFARFIRQSLTVTRRLLIKLTYKGIVDYDFETQYCKTRPKLYNYLDAIVGKIDYDLIQLESQTASSKNNATLDLQNMDLAIEGIPMVNVSDSQNVIFYPTNKQILMKKNRNFDFGGKVVAGLFEYYGDDFRFKYDSFKIVLNEIDSLSIKVKMGVNNWGRRKLANVENVLENINGEIIIDNPDNKSGVKDNPEYPIFYSKEKSYVYYDYKHVQKGKYTRDKFYFLVDEYEIDSLNDFTTEGMGYDGVLYSADIFPPIRDRLVLQEDNSLGFLRKEPDGLPLYKGKGKYFNDIHLSNRGLRGNGNMEYLTSKITSDDFIFYPDSTNAITTNFEIKETRGKVQYPQVNAQKIYIHWMPYLDNLHTEAIDDEFVMYQGKAKYTGSLEYTPKELFGSGIMAYNNGKVSSEVFNFKTRTFDADTANLEINSLKTNALALKTNNVKTQVDFDAMESKFESNNKIEKTLLPENLYEAYVQKYNWKMLKQNIQLISQEKIEEIAAIKQQQNMADNQDTISGSLFLSIHKGQDSLNWVSPIADFDLNNSILNAHEVELVKVADASIMPNKGELIINKKAQVKTLKDAKVMANNDTKYHKFHSATINISSSKKYHGEGKYNYNYIPERKQFINFDMIAVDSTGTTFAYGKIKGVEDFSLSKEFAYQGRVDLKATNPLLTFSGHTKINHECSPELDESWLKFRTEINPDSIYIPIDEPLKDINDKFLVSGPMSATDSMYVYPAFVSQRNLYSNFPVATASEYLYYNNERKTYEMGSKARLHDNDTTGNYLSLDPKRCYMYSDGEINLGTQLGQIKINTWGNSHYQIKEDELKLDVFGTMDFYLPQECIQMIADTMKSMSHLDAIKLKGNNYKKGVINLLGYAEGKRILEEQSTFGSLKEMPLPLATTFVFKDLNLKWMKKSNAWLSQGKIGFMNINGTQINKKVKGYLEIIRRRSGDEMNIYIEIKSTLWYFFNYRRGLMQMYSSYAPFNDVIANIKGSDRKLKVKRGEASYVFFLSNARKKKKFLERMKKPDQVVKEETDDKEKDKENEEEEPDDYQQYEED